jgi:PTH1 family peptidyl-tRNA hydrolase
MHLLVGLGNPGPKYAGNRHNIGFMAVDEIVRRHGFSTWRKRFQGEAAEGSLAGEKVLALKPATYMNESGRSVGEAARFFDIDPAQVIVFYDEIDLIEGKLRVKFGGGEKGLVHPHVLSDFAKADRVWLEPLIDAVAEHAGLLIEGPEGAFQNKVHLTLNPKPEKPAKKEE